MSQRKVRQSSEEVMAAREAMESKLPENVLPFSDLPDEEKAIEDEFNHAVSTAPERVEYEVEFDYEAVKLPDSDEFNEFLKDSMGENEGTPVETEAPDPTPAKEEPEPASIQVECPCCGAQILADSPEDAIQLCKCTGAKVLRQETEMNEKIDAQFGPESKARFGIEHTPDELMIMKLIAAYVAKRKIKAVTITLNGNDKAVFLIKKDATIVRHTRAIKAEDEV